MRPLLAAKAVMEKIKYPVLATPKLDGIRCLIVNGVAVSRNMKPIPNDFIRGILEALPEYDGELMVRGDFNDVQSAVMCKDGEPDFIYKVFDVYRPADEPYYKRIQRVARIEHAHIEPVSPVWVETQEDLIQWRDDWIAFGYEGAMIRQPDSPYKFGRSTVNQGYLLKLKVFQDAEGEIIGITERMKNGNVAKTNSQGFTERSSHKANLVPAGTAGKIVVLWENKEFSVGFGPGLDDSFKQGLWDYRHNHIGRTIKFSYQGLSKDGIPRFGKMLGFRDDME